LITITVGRSRKSTILAYVDFVLAYFFAVHPTYEQARMDKQSNAKQRKAQHRRTQKRQYTWSQEELKKLRATEDLRQIYRNINHAVGKDKLAGITLVIAPNQQEGEWVERTSKDAIEDACISEGQQRFHQTKGTPPVTAPLNIQLGYMGIGAAADNTLNGKYDSKPGTDKYAKILLEALSRVGPGEEDSEVGIWAVVSRHLGSSEFPSYTDHERRRIRYLFQSKYPQRYNLTWRICLR
jgi:hypothetical protein